MIRRISAEDRSSFKRCRRQWDLGSRTRRGLEPATPTVAFDLDRAVRDAMAVYYFPGMWDWSRAIVLPRVLDALTRSIDERRSLLGHAAPAHEADREACLDQGRALLERYFEWAPGADRFSPIRVEADLEVDIPDPERPGQGLTGPGGAPLRYSAHLDLLVVDEHDRYWAVRHRVAAGWGETEQLELDEESVAAGWAWEQSYLGMEIAGTIHNELDVSALGEPWTPPETPRLGILGRHQRGGIAQHEASGGGRSIPQHRRLYVQARDPEREERVRQASRGPFRRTWIRRTRAEMSEMGARIAGEAREMFSPGLSVHPTPSPDHCPPCTFLTPCLAMTRGTDPSGILSTAYRPRPPEPVKDGRLGAATWGMGRGAAPPRFGDEPRS